MGAPGCDDAPMQEVVREKAARRDVTMVVPYYENPWFLLKQMQGWMDLPVSVLTSLSVIVVDDGSPRSPAQDVFDMIRSDLVRSVLKNNIRLFRIEKDVRWNWLAARNIGAQHASDVWIMLTDMDHVLTEDALLDVTRATLSTDTIYRFSRREHTGVKIHPHPNSWLMTRDMYWRVGGYDEALSGHYGTDSEYRRRCAATAPIRILDTELVRHEHQDDSSTTHYLRKQPEDAAAKQMIRARGPAWKPKVLSFPYHEVNL